MIYEFRYRVAYARFRVKYLDLELESDPFTDLPEDQGVKMPVEVPFDDSPEVPLEGCNFSFFALVQSNFGL